MTYLIKSSANKLTIYMIRREAINRENFELYQYAFETIISAIVNISAILFIGIILKRFTETLLFLTFYCPIRQFSGGFHAENHFRCVLALITLYLCNTFILENLINLHASTFMIILTLISFAGVIYLSPQEHRDVPLNIDEKIKYKKIVTYICSFLLIISILGINFTITKVYAMYAASVIVCIFIMLVLGKIKDKGGIK